MPTLGPWPGGASFDEAGLHVAGRPATDLAEEFGTPLVLIDEEHLRERCRAFVSAFPRVLWAVKAFPLLAIMRIALDEGMDLLASTGGELHACLRAGAPGERVVLHGNNKSDRELAEAVDAGVGLVILDNAGEAERLAAAAEAAGRRQPVLLRIAPGIDVETHAYVKTAAPDTKFGTPVAGGLALAALRAAGDLDSLEVRGIHLHLGSQLLDPEPYRRGLVAALDFLEDAREALGFEASTLDLGGGMGTRYRDEQPVEPAALAAAMLPAVREGFEERGLRPPDLLMEPGRAITSGAAVTLYRVGTIKEVPDVRRFVAVDGGMSDNLRPALYGSRYTVALASRAGEGSRTVTIVGKHCESGDELARDVALAADVRRGDLVAFASTGAYEYAMASNYNKVGRPAVVMVGGGEARLVARREEYEDLTRLDVTPG